MDERAVKKIPYGVMDYEAMRNENFYYVDKTRYLHQVERAGKYLFFIRPRRFGKTLYLSVMETYYDITRKEQFETFFKGTDIFENPTPERHAYLVLKFNFSTVSPDIEAVEASFFHHVLEVADLFISTYRSFLDIDEREMMEELKQKTIPSDVLRALLHLCRKNGQKLFVIIDEYDNFANTILSTSGSGDYKKLTHGEGFFRAFFNVLKGGASGSGAPISRLFVTGVSPITLDDVTSGFNIARNITIDPEFDQMLGFSEQEVLAMVTYYRQRGLIRHDNRLLLSVMRQWYNHYLFSRKSKQSLYNPDMVLYFLDEYMESGEIPDDLIDRNVRVDYSKLRHLITLDVQGKRYANGNFSRLQEIIERGSILSGMVKGFPLERLADTENFVSLLFYFGLLTMVGPERGQVRFKIPNETVRRLYYEYIKEGYRETDVFSLDLSRYSELMGDMAYAGKWRPLFEYIARRMRQSMSLRDFITGERSIQAFLNVYLGLSNLYVIHGERELNQGYADMVMEPFTAQYADIKYAYLLEIKYLPKGQQKTSGHSNLDRQIKKIKAEAEAQLRRYSRDEKLARSLAAFTIVKLVLIFSGTDLLYLGNLEG